MDVIRALQSAFGLGDLTPMAGDVSTRRYFRASGGIVMLDNLEGGALRRQKYIDVAQRIQHAGLRAPKIFAHDENLGAIYHEDFGTRDLYTVQDDENYALALDRMFALARADAQGLTHYSQEIYHEELSRLMRFYLQPQGIHDDGLLEIAAPFFAELDAQAGAFVHVDYHAQNLMLVDGDIGFIDFQDARFGHPLYDLASFVDDIRVDMPQARAKALMDAGLEHINIKDGALWFHVLSVQRLFKIIGIFARQVSLGRSEYGPLMLRCFRLLDQRLNHPELKEWKAWREDVVPDFQPHKSEAIYG